jgi:hypothetical protein
MALDTTLRAEKHTEKWSFPNSVSVCFGQEKGNHAVLRSCRMIVNLFKMLCDEIQLRLFRNALLNDQKSLGLRLIYTAEPKPNCFTRFHPWEYYLCNILFKSCKCLVRFLVYSVESLLLAEDITSSIVWSSVVF